MAMATCLLVIGMEMSQAKRHWVEMTTVRTDGTKGRNAAIGAGGGGVIGGIAAFVIGGIGIGLCGTGIGIPAGAAMIATGAAVGAGTGAVAGAALGDSAKTISIPTEHTAAAYETWQWVLVMVIAVILYAMAMYEYKKASETSGVLIK